MCGRMLLPRSIAYYPQLACLLFACMTESHFSLLHTTSVCLCVCVWSLCVQLCRCLCCFLSLCLSALAIGSRLRLKHLKLGACHEMQTLHFDCQPETINQSHFPLLFPLSPVSLPPLSLTPALALPLPCCCFYVLCILPGNWR